MNDKVNIAHKLSCFDDLWSPKIIAAYNGNDVMLVKLSGEFVWHSHPDTDDFFLCIAGEVAIEMRDRIVTLGPGELFVVPAGVEHRPVARALAQVLLIEPRGTPNTGDPDTAVEKSVL
jgi:mannose-6-phosphate isomerase-like protein (cupin superfamily)